MAFFDIKPFAGVTVEAAEGYDHDYAGMQSLIEGYQNDFALFKGAIYSDIRENAMIHEGASVEDVMALQEGAISDFFNKIKEFFKKLWAKIKAIFKGFIAKFDSMFMKSGKQLLKKYKKDIEMKDTSELEVSFSKRKDNKEIKIDATDISVVVFNDSDPKKALENFDADEEACTEAKRLFRGLNISSMSDFDKELHDHFFEDKEDVKWSEIRNDVYDVLEKDELVKNTKKSSDNIDKTMAEIIKQINKAESDYVKDFKDDKTHSGIYRAYSATKIDDKSTVDAGSKINGTSVKVKYNGEADAESHQKKQAYLNLLSKRASAIQTAVNKATAGVVREAKFHASQCRAALAKAVAYRPKNEAAGLDTFADAVAYDPTVLL